MHIIIGMQTKKCSKCKQEKLVSEFSKNSKMLCGYDSHCKQCKRDYAKSWRESSSGVYGTLMRRHGLHIKKVEISKEDFIEWYDNEPKICAYCSIPEELIEKVPPMYNRNVKRLTIDCRDNGDKYEKGNLCLACLRCNFTKSDYFTFNEMRKIGQEVIKPKWQAWLKENEVPKS